MYFIPSIKWQKSTYHLPKHRSIRTISEWTKQTLTTLTERASCCSKNIEVSNLSILPLLADPCRLSFNITTFHQGLWGWDQGKEMDTRWKKVQNIDVYHDVLVDDVDDVNVVTFFSSRWYGAPYRGKTMVVFVCFVRVFFEITSRTKMKICRGNEWRCVFLLHSGDPLYCEFGAGLRSLEVPRSQVFYLGIMPIPSMGLVYLPQIYKNEPHVGQYAIHGWYGIYHI